MKLKQIQSEVNFRRDVAELIVEKSQVMEKIINIELIKGDENFNTINEIDYSFRCRRSQYFFVTNIKFKTI